MNYLIQIPQTTKSQMSTPVPVPVQPSNHPTILFTPTTQGCQTTSTSKNSTTAHQFPMVMPLNASNQPVFVYQNSDGLVNTGLQATSSDNTNIANNGIGQMMLTPVSPVHNGINVQQTSQSPTLSPLNMHTGNTFVPVNQQNNHATSDIAGLLKSLQGAAGVPVMKNNITTPEIGNDKSAMANFISSLQASGVHVVENNNDNTLSISLPRTNCGEEKQLMCDSNVMQISRPLEKVFKIVDGEGKVTVFTATGIEGATTSEVSAVGKCETVR